MICVCTSEQVGKYRARSVSKRCQEFDMTIRGLLGHIVCVQGHCRAMQKRL